MAEERFDENLLKLIAAEVFFLVGMQTSREMYGKSYFSLGVGEKGAVDQAVLANVGGNYRSITPEFLKTQSTPQAVGFLAQGETAKETKK